MVGHPVARITAPVDGCVISMDGNKGSLPGITTTKETLLCLIRDSGGNDYPVHAEGEGIVQALVRLGDSVVRGHILAVVYYDY